MSKDPIQPGQTFHLPAAQQANVKSLLNVLSSKPATDALKEIGKTKDSTWDSINETVVGLNDLISAGGIEKILESFKTTVDLQIADALSPFKNEVNQIITDFFAPVKVKIQDIANDLSAFVTENKTGAAIGGIAGQIASMFLPGGPILIAVGALIGATIEDLITRIGTLTQEVWEEDLQKGIDIYEGTAFGDRLADLLELLEEERRGPIGGGAGPGTGTITLPDGRVVRVVDVDDNPVGF